jgi:hypothetical protein
MKRSKTIPPFKSPASGGDKNGQEHIEASRNAEFIVGIDPGKYTGMAIWDREQEKFIVLETITFWEVIGVFREWGNRGMLKALYVRIEDPNLNKPIFWDGKKSLKGRATEDRVTQSVGMNKRDAQLLMEFMDREGIAYEAVQPTTKKLTAEEFMRLTGYKGKTNEHNRDAGKMVFRY